MDRISVGRCLPAYGTPHSLAPLPSTGHTGSPGQFEGSAAGTSVERIFRQLHVALDLDTSKGRPECCRHALESFTFLAGIRYPNKHLRHFSCFQIKNSFPRCKPRKDGGLASTVRRENTYQSH